MRLIDADALKEQVENFNCKDCHHYNFVRCRACQIDDALTYIDEAPTVGEWISVKDRLPKRCEKVIAYQSGDRAGIIIADYCDGIWFDWIDDTSTKHITHWMPLPEPPEEVTQNADGA